MDSANAASAASSKMASSLGQRLLSALVLLPLIIVVGWWSYWAVAVTIGAVTVVSLLELYGALSHAGYQPRRWVGVLSGLGLCLAVTLRPLLALPFDLFELAVMLAVVGSLLVELPSYDRREQALASWGLTLAGALYIGVLFSHFVLLRGLATPGLRPSPLSNLGLQPGAAWLYFVLAITWLQDSLAYFAGRLFGRHKMAPILSPKKTWEGAAGGMLGALLGSAICMVLFGLPLSWPAALLLGAVGGVVGPLGDLAESMIKRQVGLKDAGHLIPGHGGLLDRADSLLFTGPICFYLIALLAH